MEIAEIAMLGRVLERLAIVLIAGLSLWIGGQLFRQLDKDYLQEASFSFKGLVISCQKVGPGAFFLIFGAMTLYFATIHPVEIVPGGEKAAGAGSQGDKISYFNHSDADIKRWIAAITTAHDIAAIDSDEPLIPLDRELLKETTGSLLTLRTALLAELFTQSEIAIWLHWRPTHNENPAMIPEVYRVTFDKVNEVATRSFLGGASP